MKVQSKETFIKKLMNNSISLILILFLILGFTLPAAAQGSLTASVKTSETTNQLTDVQGNWAASQINEWVNKGLARGYEDGTFKPDNNISRAEFIALANRALGLTASVPVSFTDVSNNDWFASEIEKAQAAAYISGYEDGTIRPYAAITRQEAASMITRIAKLSVSADTTELDKYKDAADFPAWSKGAIAAVVSKNIMQGYPDLTFQAHRNISRAEAIVTLNIIITVQAPAKTGKVYDKAGTYGDAGKQETINGDVTISVAGVILQNMKITGNLILAEGIGDGDVVLKKVEVQGKSTIKGGGANSIKLEDCTLPSITIDKEGVRVVASGNTTVTIVQLESGATLVQTAVSGQGFETITISEVVPEGAKISLNGNFTNVNVAAAKVNVALTGGTITKLEVTDKASGAKLDLASGTKVDTLTLNAIVSVAGQATINNAIQNVSGTTFDTGIALGNTPSGSGSGTGGGDGNSPLNLVSSVPTDGSTDVSNSPAISMTFDRGVVRDYWDNNQNCFSLTDGSGNTVGITVSRAANYTDDSEKRTVYITPASSLSAGETYTLTVSAGLKANNGNSLGTARSISFTVAGSSGGGGGGGSNPSAPVFSSASTNNNGTKIKVSFNKNMADPSGKEAEFTVSVNGNANIVTAAALDNSDSKNINLTLTTPVVSGDTITVAYTKGTILAADGGVLASFTAQNATNTLSPAAPVFSSASTNNNGTKIKVSFNKNMADPSGKEAEFTVSVNGNANIVTAAALDNSDSKNINLTLTTPVVSGDTITVAYTKGTVQASDETVLETFSAQSVTNTLTPAAPAAPTYDSAEVTNQGDLSIYFNKVMADPVGKQAQFTVTVDGTVNIVTAVQLTNTDGKVKLTLTSKITTTGHSIIVSYTKGADETSQVKSADGGILESFTETFSN